MHIRLRLKNWRSIADAAIDFAPFTVLVGKNSTGKSNIVQALLFSNEVTRDASTAIASRGGIESIRRWSPSKPFDVTIDVRVSASHEQLDSDYTRHELVLASGADGTWHFKRETIQKVSNGVPEASLWREKTSIKTKGESSGTVNSFQIEATSSAMFLARQFFPALRKPLALTFVRSLRPAPEVMRTPQPPTESRRLSETAANITTVLHRLPEEVRERIVKSMRRIIPGLIDVRALPVGRYLTLSFKQEQGLDRRPEFVATEMSDGALRALAVIAAAHEMRRNELLVIEEPEVNLHPGAASVVYEVLHEASTRGAVLVTTHSPELLDLAGEDEILVCDYAEGVTKVGPIAGAQRALVREGLFSTAELMRSEDLRREGAEADVVQDTE